MIKFKNLLGEEGGAGDWGTDKARKRLQQDTPVQGITDIGAKNKERNESYYDKSKYRFKKRELDHELGHETKGNQGIYIDGKLWKVVGKEATAKKIVDTLHKKGKNATYMHTNKPVSESVEIDEGTLAAKDSNVIDTILDALRVKLLSDLEKGNVKDAQEIAKLVKMTIEKDYKHKGYSRLKR